MRSARRPPPAYRRPRLLYDHISHLQELLSGLSVDAATIVQRAITRSSP